MALLFTRLRDGSMPIPPGMALKRYSGAGLRIITIAPVIRSILAATSMLRLTSIASAPGTVDAPALFEQFPARGSREQPLYTRRRHKSNRRRCAVRICVEARSVCLRSEPGAGSRRWSTAPAGEQRARMEPPRRHARSSSRLIRHRRRRWCPGTPRSTGRRRCTTGESGLPRPRPRQSAAARCPLRSGWTGHSTCSVHIVAARLRLDSAWRSCCHALSRTRREARYAGLLLG